MPMHYRRRWVERKHIEKVLEPDPCRSSSWIKERKTEKDQYNKVNNNDNPTKDGTDELIR